MQRRDYQSTPERQRGRKVAVRDGSRKLIEAPEEHTTELFDLDRDPGELQNISLENADEVARLRALLAAWQRGIHAGPVLAPEQEPSDEDDEALQALGYVR